ncbi:MAG: hypothetical protein R3C02_22250 [Planctomycetaceae bacterium]
MGDKPLDGCDLSPLLHGNDADWPDRMLFSTWAGRDSVRTQQYRLDHQGELYDMLADPGQTNPITAQAPEIASRLTKAVAAWREEMSDEFEQTVPLNSGRRSVDPRPLPVGYREFPITMLPARDGEPFGDVKRSSNAPNCSYFVNWTSPDDRMVWNIDVHTTGRYEVMIDYTCPESDVGSLIELSFGDNRLTGHVTPGWDPPLFTNQDTLPRPPAESQMKEFRSLNLGEMVLKKGQGTLVLRALEIPGKTVMDVRRITLTLVERAFDSSKEN